MGRTCSWVPPSLRLWQGAEAFPSVTLVSVETLRKMHPPAPHQTRPGLFSKARRRQVGRLRHPVGLGQGQCFSQSLALCLFSFILPVSVPIVFVLILYFVLCVPLSPIFLFPSMFVSSLFTFLSFSVCLSLHLCLSAFPPSLSFVPPLPFLSSFRPGGWGCQQGDRCGWAWCPPLLGLARICGCAFFIWGCSCPLSSCFRTRDQD